MARVTGKVLLVGSVPFDTPEEVFRTAGETVGDLLSSVPDGEQGYRINWINMLAVCVYNDTPWLETVYRPDSTKGVIGWDSYDAQWKFKVKPGGGRLEHLNYLGDAKRSCAASNRRRENWRTGAADAGAGEDRGRISNDTRAREREDRSAQPDGRHVLSLYRT